MQVISGHRHSDVLVDFRLLIEDGLERFDDARWLVDLLALEHELFGLSLVLQVLFIFAKVVYHLLDGKTLAL